MSASLMRARIATKILAGLYEDVPTLLTSAIRLMVELPGGKGRKGPPYPFTIGVSPAWCSGLNGAKLVSNGKLDLVWLNPSIIPSMAVRGVGPFQKKSPLRALAVFPSWDRLVIAVSPRLGVNSMEELIAKLQQGGARVIQCTCTCRIEGYNPDDAMDKKLDALAEVARAIAREKQLPLVDLRQAFIDYWKTNNPENKPQGFLTYDGNHWTETGHQYVAEQMLKKLKL